MTQSFQVLRTYSEVAPFLEDIRKQADSEREALGFLPIPVYLEHARQNKILVLVAKDSESRLLYAGHLMFGGLYPRMRVRQICVSPKFRRQGHATRLLRALISRGETEQYLTISANVASDLADANALYERNGFETLRLKQGGSSRGRTINVRLLELKTPTLFTPIRESLLPPIPLIEPAKRSQDAPIYAVDLNVFFDVIKRRQRSGIAGALIEAALRHQVRIVATPELVTELERSSNDPTNDPVLAFAKRIPSLPKSPASRLSPIFDELAPIVFPERYPLDQLRAADKSDIYHLAHSIVAGAAGYITSDEKVLAARDTLMSKFKLDLIGLEEFVELVEPSTDHPIKANNRTAHFSIRKPTIEEITSLVGNAASDIGEFVDLSDGANRNVVSVSDDSGVIGFSAIKINPAIEAPSKMVAHVQQHHPFASTVADYLIQEQIRYSSHSATTTLQLLDLVSQPITRRIALSYGFQPLAGHHSNTLTKIALGRAITDEDWGRLRLTTERISNLLLPRDRPRYDHPAVRLRDKSGGEYSIGLFELETLLSPAIFAFDRRAAVVVPITTEFAGHLLGTDDQFSFLEVPEATFLSRRTYFNTTRAASAMIRGGVIVFYESLKRGGRGAVVALGRIVDATVVDSEDMPEEIRRQGVVDDVRRLTTANKILATTFDNIVALKNPVSLQKLREIGCANGANFVSATTITDTHLKSIVAAANE